MKKITFAALAALTVASSAVAGETWTRSSKDMKQPMPPEPCFRDREWQVDIFGAYAFTRSNQDRILGDHAWGGGLGLNYFFLHHVGVGIEGSLLDAGDTIGQAALNIFLRLPMDDICLAPYLFAGAGGVFNAEEVDTDDLFDDDTSDDDAFWSGHLGVGIEYRFNPNVGIFVDGRYTVVDKHSNNFATIRTGLRIAF